MEFNWLDLSTVDNRGAYTGRIKRHATVKVEGLRGAKDKAMRVLKLDWPYIWVTPVEELPDGQHAANRAAERRRSNYRPSVDHKLDGQRVKLGQVTHVAISNRAPRRRRPRW